MPTIHVEEELISQNDNNLRQFVTDVADPQEVYKTYLISTFVRKIISNYT